MSLPAAHMPLVPSLLSHEDGSLFEIGPELSIGGGPKCDLRIKGAQGRIAVIRRLGPASVLTVEDPAHPVYVNHRPVSELWLRDGDQVVIAGCQFGFLRGDPTARVTPEPSIPEVEVIAASNAGMAAPQPPSAVHATPPAAPPSAPRASTPASPRAAGSIPQAKAVAAGDNDTLVDAQPASAPPTNVIKFRSSPGVSPVGADKVVSNAGMAGRSDAGLVKPKRAPRTGPTVIYRCPVLPRAFPDAGAFNGRADLARAYERARVALAGIRALTLAHSESATYEEAVKLGVRLLHADGGLVMAPTSPIAAGQAAETALPGRVEWICRATAGSTFNHPAGQSLNPYATAHVLQRGEAHGVVVPALPQVVASTIGNASAPFSRAGVERFDAVVSAPVIMGGHIAAVVELRFGDLDDDTLATNTEALALLTWQLAERFEELDARQKLGEAGWRPRLARFLSPGQIDAVLLQPDVLAPGGVRCDAAVLCMQFRGVGFGETETPAVDAGQWARQLARVRESVARIVSGLDGTLIHFGPDAVLAVWGWPLRPEHDGNATAAVLAVRAAQQLHGTLKTQLANGHSTPRGMLGTARQPRFGIGIEFGPVFAAGIEVSSGLDLVVMGETVHIARGLADRAAAREEILVGETSHHAIDGAFAVTGHETVRLKVSNGPMRAHRIAVGQAGGVETGLGRVAAARN